MVFYFTYGLSDTMPFQGGWTKVTAPDAMTACAIFRAYHPDTTPGLMNCSFMYTAADFEKSSMFRENDNFGVGCHEEIVLTRTLLNGGEPSA